MDASMEAHAVVAAASMMQTLSLAGGRSMDEVPSDVLQLIGSLLSDPSHVSAASMVCREWRERIIQGVQALELDMNPTPGDWQQRLERLRRMMPQLLRCRAHVSGQVPKLALPANISALAELQSVEELQLDLSEDLELWLDSGLELSALSALRCLTITSGLLQGEVAQRLLAGLARACPRLEGKEWLGDEEVPFLVAISGLKVLEFQAYRLTNEGLRALMALPHLEALQLHGLDLEAYDTSCFALRPSLKTLHLSLDYMLPPSAVEALRHLPGLSMRFRWTEKLHGLLKTCSVHLSHSLVRLHLGCCRVFEAGAFHGLGRLTGLQELRMSLWSNQDRANPITLHLSELAPLSKLQVLHITKKQAYFPEERRFSESSLAIPVSGTSAVALAASCRQLKALRLCLSRSDVQLEGLRQLSAFTALRSLAVFVEPCSPREPLPLDLEALPPLLTSLECRGVEPRCDVAAAQRPAMALLKLEGCRATTQQLRALVRMLPQLACLRLVNVSGLADEAIESLHRLTLLSELAVVAPQNRAVTQASMHALAPLRNLRSLTWQSPDLTGNGPVLSAFTSFTALRLLSLSCTPQTVRFACGSLDVLHKMMPFADVNLMPQTRPQSAG